MSGRMDKINYTGEQQSCSYLMLNPDTFVLPGCAVGVVNWDKHTDVGQKAAGFYSEQLSASKDKKSNC